MYELIDVSKTYRVGESDVAALRGVDLRLGAGEFVAIVGPSGSGKSTLLNLLGLLDRPSAGTLTLDGVNVADLDEKGAADLRLRQIGFIFQAFNLLASLRAWENVAVPAVLAGRRLGAVREQCLELLARVGLVDRAEHFPSQLSGGQMQRVAIARALSLEPHVILADEPTGNLDSASGEEVVGLLRKAASDTGRTVVIVTHDPQVAAVADRQLTLRDGQLVNDARVAR
ncbi:MAG TPA: ABC transporter ATP-binding protein [Micromonosporaceae bacterium]|nr:ABC transporter ATP-binding protein [Micromonosporaceae bacterium]